MRVGAYCVALLLMLAPVARADSLEEITEQFLTETQPVKRLYPIEYLVPGLDISGGLFTPANSLKVLETCRQQPELFRLLFWLIEPTPPARAEIEQRCRLSSAEVDAWLTYWSTKPNHRQPPIELTGEVLAQLASPKDREQAVRNLLARTPSTEGLRLLLPWVEDPKWCAEGPRSELFTALSEVRVDEAGPALQRLLSRGQDDHLDLAAGALAFQTGPDAEPYIRNAMQGQSGAGFLKALHTIGRLRREDVVSRLESQDYDSLGSWLRWNPKPPPEVCAWILAAIPELEARESYASYRWLEYSLQWQLPEVDEFLIRRLSNGELSPVGLAGLLSRAPKRPDLLEKVLSGYEWGYVALLLRDEDTLTEVFRSSDLPAQRAVLAGARRIRYRLGQSLIEAGLANPALKQDTYLYLTSFHQPWARQVLKGLAPEGLVLGPGGGRPWDGERLLMTELEAPGGPVRIVQISEFLGPYTQTSVIREWGDRVTYRREVDPYRYVVAAPERAAVKELMDLLEDPATATLPPLRVGYSHPDGFCLSYLTKTERWRIGSELDFLPGSHPFLLAAISDFVLDRPMTLAKQFSKLRELGELRYKVIDQKGGRILKADPGRRLNDDRYFYKHTQTLATAAGHLSADHDGLFLGGRRVADWQFHDAAVSSDGRWAALAKPGEGTAAPDLLVVFDCSKLESRAVQLPRYLLVRPLRYIPELESFLVWCPQRDNPEFYLVEPQSGDWRVAEGELSPYTHSCDFQASSWPDWVWATRIRQQGDVDVTEVGLYHRYRFVFLPAGTYPHLLAKSNEITVLPDQRVVRVRLVNDEIELPLDTVPTPTSSWK